jgi:hypothetical protein
MEAAERRRRGCPEESAAHTDVGYVQTSAYVSSGMMAGVVEDRSRERPALLESVAHVAAAAPVAHEDERRVVARHGGGCLVLQA